MSRVTLSLRLERFGWTAGDRLELVGRWSGLQDPSALTPTLVVRTASAVERLEAVPDSVSTGEDSIWSAAFTYARDGADLERVTLVMGEDLLVELPLPVVGTRRFGRQLLRAHRTPRAVNAATMRAEVPAGVGQPAAEAAKSHDRGDRPRAPTAVDMASASPLELHGALIRAQEELEELRAEAARAGELAEVARHDADREKRRRVADADRLREALATARNLADDQLVAERQAAATLRSELDDALKVLAAQRDEAARLQAELEADRREGAETAEREAAAARERAEAISVELDQVRAELEQRSEAVASLSAALEQARQGEQVARARSEALQQRVDAARAAIGDLS